MTPWVSLIVFIVLLAVLGKFAWKPLVSALDGREASIAKQIEEANRRADEAQRRLEECEAKLAQAAQEIESMKAKAREDAEDLKGRIIAEAKAAAEREGRRAAADIRLATDAAVRELSRETVDLAVALAGRMLRSEVDAQAQARLIHEALEQFPSRN